MKKAQFQITCPECGHEFSPETAIAGQLKAHLEKEYAKKLESQRKSIETEVRASAMEGYQAKIKALESESSQKSKQLKKLEEQAVDLATREKELKVRAERQDLALKKHVLKVEEQIRKDAEKGALEKAEIEFQEREAEFKRQKDAYALQAHKHTLEAVERAREEEHLKQAEIQKKLDDQIKLAKEMDRKGNQGSMQLQGEVQELAIEDFLKSSFPRDIIEEISKGVRGGDCVHVVRDNMGNTCGSILYESKRTKTFSKDWIAKVKEDMRSKQADIAVIVTEAMPAGLNRFGEVEGVWICSYPEFKSVSLLLRRTLLRIGEVLAAQENKGEKMQLLYDYLTGSEFRQKIDSIREAFEQMSTDLQKEKAQAISNFSKREKQISKVIENTMALYGDVRGIAGGAVQSIPALECDEEIERLLNEKSDDPESR